MGNDVAASCKPLTDHGTLAVEMKSSTLYALAARFGVRAVSVCTTTDCLITGDELDGGQRQSFVEEMVHIALGVATDLD